MIDSASIAVGSWRQEEVTGSKTLTSEFLAAAKGVGNTLCKYPNLCSFALKYDLTGVLIGSLLKSAKSKKELIRVLALSGERISSSQLGSLLNRAQSIFSEDEWDVVSDLFRRYPSHAKQFLLKKDFNNYILAVSLAPDIEASQAGRKRFGKVFRTHGKKFIERNPHHLGRVLFPIDWSPFRTTTNTVSSGTCSQADPAYATEFQKGDALYRDLDSGWVANHWHAGLFSNFRACNGTGWMILLHVSKESGIGENLVKTIIEEGDFNSPNQSLSQTIKEIRKKFVLQFCNGEKKLKLQAIKTVSGITLSQRNSVISTAFTLMSYDFGYTFIDMMDYCGFGWNGSYSDIDEMRCDGLVEFAYEKNGLKVCDGKKKKLWNISKGRKKHPENHNDVHNNSINPGELCPRIQSGEAGSNSHFVTPQIDVPIINRMIVSSRKSDPVSIRFIVTAKMSNLVFCRLRVRPKSNSSFHFVKGKYLGFMFDWRLFGIPAGQEIEIVWGGEIFGSASFQGKDGEYVFSLQGIDEGGNVSEEICRVLEVKW